jgi:solute carrier family 6 amino acid transporter-like protein 5/7/9/14
LLLLQTVVTDGPGLVFVTFPHALSQMPVPQLWAIIFFTMLVVLGEQIGEIVL